MQKPSSPLGVASRVAVWFCRCCSTNLLYSLHLSPWLNLWPSFTPSLFCCTKYCFVAFSHTSSGLYLPEVLLKALVRGSEQSSDAEAVAVLLVSDLRLFQKRVQLLSDLRLHLMMAAALRVEEGGENKDTCLSCMTLNQHQPKHQNYKNQICTTAAPVCDEYNMYLNISEIIFLSKLHELKD